LFSLAGLEIITEKVAFSHCQAKNKCDRIFCILTAFKKIGLVALPIGWNGCISVVLFFFMNAYPGFVVVDVNNRSTVVFGVGVTKIGVAVGPVVVVIIIFASSLTLTQSSAVPDLVKFLQASVSVAVSPDPQISN